MSYVLGHRSVLRRFGCGFSGGSVERYSSGGAGRLNSLRQVWSSGFLTPATLFFCLPDVVPHRSEKFGQACK
jgi:hypothetical protein